MLLKLKFLSQDNEVTCCAVQAACPSFFPHGCDIHVKNHFVWSDPLILNFGIQAESKSLNCNIIGHCRRQINVNECAPTLTLSCCWWLVNQNELTEDKCLNYTITLTCQNRESNGTTFTYVSICLLLHFFVFSQWVKCFFLIQVAVWIYTFFPRFIVGWEGGKAAFSLTIASS